MITQSALGLAALLLRSLVAGLAIVAFSVQAQNVNNGFALYNAILVPGNPNCASGGCHGPDPSMNQNRILNGDDPSGIAYAIATVRQMSFLRGRLTSAELADLAAYIANPGAVTSAPRLQVSPESIDFGAVAVGTGETRALTLMNAGSGTLTVSEVRTSDAPFNAAAAGCAALGPGQACTVNVEFRPTAPGMAGGTLTILHNAANSPSSVAISGRGTIAIGALFPAVLDFGELWLGAISAPRELTMTNVGEADLIIDEVFITHAGFSVGGGTCAPGVRLTPLASCTLMVRARATVAGMLLGELIVRPAGPALPVSVALAVAGRALPAGTRLMTEFRFAPLDYYFITSRPDEQALLDGIAGFERTGESFPVYVDAAEGRAALSRYFFAMIARGGTRGSHFYTAIQAEKDLLRSHNPGNLALPRLPYDEGVDAWVELAAAASDLPCRAGMQAVWRLFRGNARFPDDPNHRFVVRRDLYDAFVSAGWDGEGVRFCVPVQ